MKYKDKVLLLETKEQYLGRIYVEGVKSGKIDPSKRSLKGFISGRSKTMKKLKGGKEYDLLSKAPVNKYFLNIAWAISFFRYDFASPSLSGIKGVYNSISRGDINADKLSEELNKALKDTSFKWDVFLTSNKIFEKSKNLSNEEAKEMISSWLSDFLDKKINKTPKK